METDQERLSTLDEFGSRKFVIPAEVQGPYRRLRTLVYWPLLLLFLAVPWITVNEAQLLVLDFPHRHFEIFGQHFLAHDSPLIFLIAAFLVLMLAFVTAVWGRVWCGWACPQTVFIDAVYRQIEIWIEGSYLERRRAQREPLTATRLARGTFKWICYLVVSSLFAHSFVAYFTGGSQLLAMMQGSPTEHWSYFLCVSFMTALLLFDFGWFREQFCIIMCPYGRFQSVLMDSKSLSIVYDEARGEPRKGLTTTNLNKKGDCVSCNRCVEVCPTGIDIRKGQQLECIACTACIDACNVIMKKVNKAPDLISYRSLQGQSRGRLFRPRPLAYLGLATLSALVFVMAFLSHEAYSITVLRGQGSPYQILPGDMIENHFKAHILNQSIKQEEFVIELPEDFRGLGFKLTQQSPSTVLNSGQSAEIHLFLIFPKSSLNQLREQKNHQIDLVIREMHGHEPIHRALTIVGPEAL